MTNTYNNTAIKKPTEVGFNKMNKATLKTIS